MTGTAIRLCLGLLWSLGQRIHLVLRPLEMPSLQRSLNFGAHLDDILVLQTPTDDLNSDRGVPPDLRIPIYAISPGHIRLRLTRPVKIKVLS